MVFVSEEEDVICALLRRFVVVVVVLDDVRTMPMWTVRKVVAARRSIIYDDAFLYLIKVLFAFYVFLPKHLSN